VGSAGAIGQCLVLRMDGVGVKGDENVLSAGARKLVLRLVRVGGDPEALIELSEWAQQTTQKGWIVDRNGWVRMALMSGPGIALNRRLRGFGIGRLSQALRSLLPDQFLHLRFGVYFEVY
jgi:hypothetical protein